MKRDIVKVGSDENILYIVKCCSFNMILGSLESILKAENEYINTIEIRLVLEKI